MKKYKKSSRTSIHEENGNIQQQEIELVKAAGKIFCCIDREPIRNVKSYAIVNDGNGQTNLVLTIELKAGVVLATIRERNSD